MLKSLLFEYCGKTMVICLLLGYWYMSGNWNCFTVKFYGTWVWYDTLTNQTINSWNHIPFNYRWSIDASLQADTRFCTNHILAIYIYILYAFKVIQYRNSDTVEPYPFKTSCPYLCQLNSRNHVWPTVIKQIFLAAKCVHSYRYLLLTISLSAPITDILTGGGKVWI